MSSHPSHAAAPVMSMTAAPAASVADAAAGLAAGFDNATGLKNMQQLIQLRWFAVGGQLVAVLLVHFGFGIRLPLQQMLVVLAALVVFNLASLWRWRRPHHVTNLELFVALLVDVAMLTAQLYLSGGAGNPFVFLYLLQVTLGAVLLAAWSTWTIVAVTALCFAGLAWWGRPLALPPAQAHDLANPYVVGLLVCFVLNAALLVVFITRIGRNLRERDARLASLRQRAAEEEHIVRMGLLASGAAHELGTPLSTVSVIVGDWLHSPHFTSDAELLGDLEEMRNQVQRCKTIVSGILLSAGRTRGESSVPTTLNAFLADLVKEWRSTRPVKVFVYQNHITQDLPVVSDSALKQMIANVLDNALEASPQWLRLEVTRDAETLTLVCADEGPGFASAMLRQFGKPYQSSKGRPGGGLGLFLVVNVARTLGGSVSAQNRPEVGAEVTIRLPLAAVTTEIEPDAD